MSKNYSHCRSAHPGCKLCTRNTESKVTIPTCIAARSVFLVFEYCAHDLGRLLDTMPRKFYEPEVKCLLKQVQSKANILAVHILQLFDQHCVSVTFVTCKYTVLTDITT